MNLETARAEVEAHLTLLSDRSRLRSFHDAIRSSVRPGDVVLDLGTGSGVLAIFACQAGARRVYAVERSRLMVTVAHEMAIANGFGDRILLLHSDIADVEVPEPIDVLIAELLANAGAFGEDMSRLMDAARRFLRAGARCVPEEVALHIALSSNRDGRCDLAPLEEFGVGGEPLARRVSRSPFNACVAADDLLSRPEVVHVFRSTEGGASPHFNSSVIVDVAKDGVARTLVAWFEATLVSGVELANAPGGPPTSWRHVVLPLTEPIEVHNGSRVAVEVGARSHDALVLWKWRVSLDATR